MPSIQQVRQSNSLLHKSPPGMVAVMPGATNGIGEATCKAWVQYTKSPTVYIVGRNETRANKTIAELKAINPSATFHFMKRDLSLLRNVDEVCRKITEKESKINLLFLSPGFLSLNGRDETSEGLDKMLSLQFYARIRFIVNLLGCLQNAADGGELARVVSVLNAGKEGPIIQDDFALEKPGNYSLGNCSFQSGCMTSLVFEHLAKTNPTISFVHVTPGVVRGTNIMKEMGSVTSVVIRGLMALVAPFTFSVKESGERHLYAATSDNFRPGKKNKGRLSFRLGPNGEECGENENLTKHTSDGTFEKVWAHTQSTFKRICK